MSQDLGKPPWMEDCLGEAMTRLTTRIGDSGFTTLTDAVAAAGQSRAFQELMAGSDFFGEQIARQHEWLGDALAEGTLLESRYWAADHWDRALSAPHGVPYFSFSVAVAMLSAARMQQSAS